MNNLKPLFWKEQQSYIIAMHQLIYRPVGWTLTSTTVQSAGAQWPKTQSHWWNSPRQLEPVLHGQLMTQGSHCPQPPVSAGN